MKRILILATCFGAAATGTAPAQVFFPGSVVDADDNVAGLLLVAGKARIADEGAELKDTSKKALAELETRAAAASVDPTQALAAAMAKAMAQEMGKAMGAELAKLNRAPAPAAAT